ncbi:YtxH domain-containing protein [Viridibacillus sp. YIM B01967]|uniref:YtxH domain-containing protein n=1 Tax=Viridibacillus soli TaxID=2798301 RepID=A0ABS1H8Q4_9BACL|nr:YtxH domain-containing protein [Viridibacillus soli]MBK3495793.1 YtxH domain-containing protein [Viridibacillus soli]
MTNKLFVGIAIGAFTGAAISMLDRTTRNNTVNTVKNIAEDVQYYAKNRDELAEKVQIKVEKYQSLYNTFTTEKDYYLEKINEIQSFSPQVKNLLTDTKNAFVSPKEEEEDPNVIHL